MPIALSLGVSYSDFWKMTLGEIFAVVNRADTDRLKTAAFTAYHTGGFSRCERFPESLPKAFPSLYGLAENGGVKAEDWKVSKMAMAARVAAFNAAKKKQNRERFGGTR